MTGLQLGAGSITEAQLLAFTATAVVLAFLLTANLAVCWMYRRATGEDRRRAQRVHKKKMSDVWVYHVHRASGPAPSPAPAPSPRQQILDKLRASHENLRAQLAARGEEGAGGEGGLSQEESQVLEELQVTADLFLHDTSHASSRRSSLASGSSRLHPDTDSLRSALHVFDMDTTLRDLDASTDLRDLDPASALRDLDRVSVTSVTKADFENDSMDTEGGEGGRRRRGGRKSKRRHSKRSNQGDNQHTLPVAEFHNEAFDFAESTFTAVERVQDVEL